MRHRACYRRLIWPPLQETLKVSVAQMWPKSVTAQLSSRWRRLELLHQDDNEYFSVPPSRHVDNINVLYGLTLAPKRWIGDLRALLA